MALSIGGGAYLHLFSSKGKIVSLMNKAENEKDSDTSDNLPEADNDDDFQTLAVLVPLPVFEKSQLIQISTYHSSLSLFSEYSSKPLMGYSDVILQPPRV